MAYDPNYSIVVGGHAQSYGPDGSLKFSDSSAVVSYADTAAIQAIGSTTRLDGMTVVKLDDSTVWTFDAEGAAVAATWCIVPTSGTGRWYRSDAGRRTTATIATLKAVPLLARVDGGEWLVIADGSLWRFAATSSLTGDDFLAVSPTVAGGAYIRVDRVVDITAAVAYTTADAAVLYTVPTGFQLQLGIPYNHVTTSFAGGSSSAIGASSSNGGMSTKGDVLGGSGGDVAATLVSTGAWAKGTVGAKIGKPAALLVAGDTLIFDRITSVFTSGVGVYHFPVTVLLAPAS